MVSGFNVFYLTANVGKMNTQVEHIFQRGWEPPVFFLGALELNNAHRCFCFFVFFSSTSSLSHHCISSHVITHIVYGEIEDCIFRCVFKTCYICFPSKSGTEPWMNILGSARIETTTGMSTVLSKWIITPIQVGCKSPK